MTTGPSTLPTPSRAHLRIVAPGFLATVQDLGRPGRGALGIPAGGAADTLSLCLGNGALGNDEHAAAIEMTITGATMEFYADTTIALAGASCEASVASPTGPRRSLTNCTPMRIAPGDVLRIGPFRDGARVYLCIAGGLDVPEVLGSRSTLLARDGGFGGHNGRGLAAGDTITLGHHAPSVSAPLAGAALILLRESLTRRTLRAVGGAHVDRFDSDARHAFWAGAYTIAQHSNRTGLRLEGAPIHSAESGSLRTEAMMHGAIEVPQDGLPVVLMNDHPTTGGYPVIACIAAVDLPTLGQLRPGDTIRFERITRSQALALYRERERILESRP